MTFLQILLCNGVFMLPILSIILQVRVLEINAFKIF